MNKKTCGELLVEILAAYGVDTVFGIPGVHTVELYRGLPNTPIRHITPRHEQGAGFMADGYARATGKVGVCFIITGPGMTNITTAMAQAKADSIPMLVISSVNKIAHTGSGAGHLMSWTTSKPWLNKWRLTAAPCGAWTRCPKFWPKRLTCSTVPSPRPCTYNCR